MKQLLVEVTTTKSIEEVEVALKESLDRISFGILAELNLGDKMRSKGIDFEGELKTYEVCNPVHANEILSHQGDIKYLLPCKITLSKKDDVITLGMIDFPKFEGLISEEANHIANEIFDKLKNVLINSVK